MGAAFQLMGKHLYTNKIESNFIVNTGMTVTKTLKYLITSYLFLQLRCGILIKLQNQLDVGLF
jgi:hypothetical protein